MKAYYVCRSYLQICSLQVFSYNILYSGQDSLIIYFVSIDSEIKIV